MIVKKASILKPRKDGILNVSLHQVEDSDATACKALLQSISKDNAELSILSAFQGLHDCQEEFKQAAANRTLVGLAHIGPDSRNTTFISYGNDLLVQHKISLSTDDVAKGVSAGDSHYLFTNGHDAEAISWAVLNCSDYTDASLVLPLLKEEIELLVVVANNAATRLYWEYALSDIHRLFCFVVIVNSEEYGGSGVFAPLRRIGKIREESFGAAGQIFATRGPGTVSAIIPLNVGQLRGLRQAYRKDGIRLKEGQREKFGADPVVPSQHFMDTFDCPAGAPRVAQDVQRVDIEWDSEKPRIAVAQLDSMSMAAYRETGYRIRKHKTAAEFETRLEGWLAHTEARCRMMGPANGGALLDFLVLPEVFVPRSFVGNLQAFSDRLGTVVIAGVDYPGETEEENANHCMIVSPHTAPHPYHKITRSQYDAQGRTSKSDPMTIRRGQQLMRFTNSHGRSFGVLVCYDYSHLDLVHHLNMVDPDSPLELLFVVAHNPFSELYRSCCIADSHRFYQYVVMCNVAAFGGSGVFGPLRSRGSRQTVLDIGKGTEAVAITEIDLHGLRTARAKLDSDLRSDEVFMRWPPRFRGLSRAQR